ncbi:FG-GAP-like repeat-containing protein [Streptomyces sp. NPDC088131]|uniref:FG-GAP-like repeat-containing protein n=1 Tax=Streptomyces sp. NPDC088131 TaxID=3365826 RepID=UPI00381F6775
MSTRKKHTHRPLGLRRRALLTVGVLVLSGAGSAAYATSGPASGPAGGTPTGDHRARAAAVRTVELAGQGAGRKGLPKQSTKEYSAALLTWSDPDAKIEGTAQIRSKGAGTGKWSGWQTLPDDPFSADGREAEDAATRGGTSAVWTGPSDGVEVRVVAADGSASALPSGMDVKLLDPGTDPAGAAKPAGYARDATPPPSDTGTDTPVPADATSPPTDPATPTPSPTGPAVPTDSPTDPPVPTTSPSPTAPAPLPSTVVKPPIITQAQWGASTDYDGTPGYGQEIKAAVVHHTGVDQDNGVPCSQSRARMRTIQQEHFARGYYDIGYNFVVDRCGQIFEGRSGGMDLPVIGAHDVGFNTNTVGISYIGNTMTMKATRAGLEAISRVVAWKFGMYGISPSSDVTLVSGSPLGQDGNKVAEGDSITLPRVFGHRDTNATLCPGDALYGKLPLIRTLAAAPGVSHALTRSDFDGDGVTDLVAGTPQTGSGAGSLTVVPGGDDGPVASAGRIIDQNSPGVPGSSESGDFFGASNAYGDVNGDGYGDLVIGSPGEDDTSGHADSGLVSVLYGPALDTGTSYGTATATRAAGEALGTSVATGDFNADGKSDIFSVAPGVPGRWWSYDSGTGAATSGYLNTTAYTAAVSYAAVATGDFNRDGYADAAVNFRDPSGISRVLWLKGSSGGLQRVGILSAKGGRSLAAGDVTGDGIDDLVVGQPGTTESGTTAKGGTITLLKGTTTGLTATGAITLGQDSADVPGGGETGDDLGASVAVGDYDLDGYADVMAGSPNEDITRAGVSRVDAGAVILFKGTSAGISGTGSVTYNQDTPDVSGDTESGDRLGSSVLLQDLSGYGRADLAIGADGENAGDGVFLQLDSGSAGISAKSALYYGRSNLGTPAAAHLGQTLAP